ncbi:C39 family peptidase [Virgibacillus siamensis]|uniref:C39 family peptidase n=1 Tax=Virgibacillus siamensis TaxID=480071 RepID=UPI0009844928|nr:C39 family peptidase [Virgibacillus siamensis]
MKINDIPTYYQYPELPTGCEATALAMLLNWAGIDVSRYDIADAMPKGDKVRFLDGKWKGANPNVNFVGDPYSDDGSFGVFEGPILKTAENFMPGKAVDLTGKPFEKLLDIVRNGTPVVTWTTLEQRETFHSKTWSDPDGNIINWFRFEHAVLMIGMDEKQVIVNDPHTGREEHYDRVLFEKNWESMGGRAVTLDMK